jgi:hypothetical protein
MNNNCKSPADHTKRPCRTENEATVAPTSALTKASFLKLLRPKTYNRNRASTTNASARAKLIWYPNNMFSYCLKLKTRNETGTKRRSHDDDPMTLSLTSKRMTNVVRRQIYTRYISTTLSYFVMLPSRSSTLSGKNILCSLWW